MDETFLLPASMAARLVFHQTPDLRLQTEYPLPIATMCISVASDAPVPVRVSHHVRAIPTAHLHRSLSRAGSECGPRHYPAADSREHPSPPSRPSAAYSRSNH